MSISAVKSWLYSGCHKFFFFFFLKWVDEICKSLYSVLIYILQSSPIFLDLGLYITKISPYLQVLEPHNHITTCNSD